MSYKSKVMKPRVFSFRLHFTNVYLIEQDGRLLLVDTGNRGQVDKALKHITTSGFDLTDLKYIFLTHTHYDHAGSVAGIQKQTGAKVIVHRSEAGNLQKGFTPIPLGATPVFKAISFMGRKLPGIEKMIARYDPVEADIVFDEKLDLSDLGFDGYLLHTPGHTGGSSSLILGEKAFVGDAMFNFRGMIFPGFANDEKMVGESWKKLLALNVKWFYPAHGKRVSRERLAEEAEKRGII